MKRPATSNPRGMTLAPYLRDGHQVAELTDSHNRCIASVTLVPGVDPSVVRAFFRDIINAADPKTELRIVK